jgi:Rod binding domain-containing protein
MNALPSIPDSALPADVRSGSAADKQAYKAALGFEQVMLGELVKASTESTPLAEGPYAGAVNDAFSSALANAGGTGLAAQLYAQIRSESQTDPATGAGEVPS